MEPVARPIVESIPDELRQFPQWVCWRYEERKGKRTKVPFCAQNGGPASSTDPQTWCSFTGVLNALQRNEIYNGIGFVLSDSDPYCGIDIDDCLDELGDLVWGQDVVEMFDTYTEISPSGRGVKLFLRGKKPPEARSRIKGLGPNGDNTLEIYDRARFFAVTGRTLVNTRSAIANRQAVLESFCSRYWQVPAPVPSGQVSDDEERSARCLEAMLRMNLGDHNDGSHRLFAACCRCVEHDLCGSDALNAIRAYAQVRPFPVSWSDEDILRRLRDAERTCQRGAVVRRDQPVVLDGLLSHMGIPSLPTEEAADDSPKLPTRSPAQPKSIEELVHVYPELRPPVIHGLLRRGESANIIAPPKTGKSWLAADLAIAVASGRPWLDSFNTEPGDVLIIDNELHGETSANRVPRDAAARGVPWDEYKHGVFIENLRGKLRDIHAMAGYFQTLEPGRYQVIVLDAFYRFLPRDTDENDNGAMANIYNQIDWCADYLGCSFVLIHHASKGNQSGKSVTDVGSGAGSQSRATDAHLVLRPHEEPDCVVLEAAVRSWPPVDPICLRWRFPVWNPDPSLDPFALRGLRRGRTRASHSGSAVEPAWTVEQFVSAFLTENPRDRSEIVPCTQSAGLSQRKATQLLRQAESQGLVHRWSFGANRPVKFATVEQHEENSERKAS
jgi:hypothetical protein